jgi:hypothetical protein
MRHHQWASLAMLDNTLLCTSKVYNRSHSEEHNPTFLLTTKQHIVDRGYSTGKSVNQRTPQTKCVPHKRIHTSAHEQIRKHQPPCQLQLHPLTSERFHALLNSLFKVLFNFPSRYLFAIGLVLYVALDGVYHPIRSAFPSKPTLE